MGAASGPWFVTRMPLARWLFAGRPAGAATRATDQLGTLWRPRAEGPLPLVIVFSDSPGAMAWLASSIAAELSAVVLVPSTDADPLSVIAGAQVQAGLWGVDAARIAVIGEQRGTDAALSSAHAEPGSAPDAGTRAVARLALVSPRLPQTDKGLDLPPTLLQFSRSDADLAHIVAFEKRLRLNGVAVRATDYTDIGDGWTRYPRAIRHSTRALDDLVAFLRRGIGVDSTFDVIPGWDLH